MKKTIFLMIALTSYSAQATWIKFINASDDYTLIIDCILWNGSRKGFILDSNSQIRPDLNSFNIAAISKTNPPKTIGHVFKSSDSYMNALADNSALYVTVKALLGIPRISVKVVNE